MNSKSGGWAGWKLPLNQHRRGGCAVSNQLSELAAVAATDIEHRQSGDITQKVSLRGHSTQPI